ncbi:hypothetical protein, partial [Serratia marcescens]|uniref:hypothetical protein n=1 Tax=Serratia marcescens TaxID=615 RepID=UPI00195397B2
ALMSNIALAMGSGFCLVRSYIGLLRHEEQLFKLADIDDELLAAQESKLLAENMMLDSLGLE